MLEKIIARFFDMSEDNAIALIELLTLEKQWQENQSWNGQEIQPGNIQTQADLFFFLQALGQSHWFKGHDRSTLPESTLDTATKNLYFDLFRKIGLIDLISYENKQSNPHFSVVLGSSQSQVEARVQTLAEDLARGILPTENIIFGLGCNRELGVSVKESEMESKLKLQESKKATTEMEMVTLITQEMLDHFNYNTNGPQLTYIPIDTTSMAKNRQDETCVKTAETAASLKKMIETDPRFTAIEKPIIILTYSCQPFVDRQCRDVQQKLGDPNTYQVFGAGKGVIWEEFSQYSRAINICLGEMARLININYTHKNLVLYQTPLTEEENRELMALCDHSRDDSLQLKIVSKPMPGRLFTHANTNIIYAEEGEKEESKIDNNIINFTI